MAGPGIHVILGVVGSLPSACAALGIAVVASIAVWKLARTRFAPWRIAVFAVAAALGWMVLLRAWSLPYTSWTDGVRRVAAAGVGTAWFVVIRDAVRGSRAERNG